MVGPQRLRKLSGRVVSVCAERWQLEMLSSAGNVDQSHCRWRWWVPEVIEDNDGVKRSTLKWQSCRLFWNVLEASEVAVMPVWCGIDDRDQVWVERRHSVLVAEVQLWTRQNLTTTGSRSMKKRIGDGTEQLSCTKIEVTTRYRKNMTK